MNKLIRKCFEEFEKLFILYEKTKQKESKIWACNPRYFLNIIDTSYACEYIYKRIHLHNPLEICKKN